MGDKLDASLKSDIQAKIAELKKTMEGEDVNAIKSSIENLEKASHKLAEELYQKQNMGGANPGAGAAGQPGGAQQNQQGKGKGDDDVVDADFTEVKK